MNIHQKTVIFFEKKDENILEGGHFITKNYKNILKFNFLMSPLRHIDCFHRFMKR